MTDRPPRASRLEILGCWLHVWTPPRDVYVPPVPWRKVAAGVGVLALLGVFTALVIAPAIDDAKDESAAEQQRGVDERAAARRAQAREDQRAITGALPAQSPLTVIERRIGVDARERFEADGRAAQCERVTGSGVTATRHVYDCFVTVREIEGAAEQEGARGALGIPYRAVLDFEAGRYAFCKVNPVPGETAVPDPDAVVALPAGCRRRA